MATSRSFGGTSVTSRPPIQTNPSSTSSSPASIRSAVDLPEPDGPTSTISSPSPISRSSASTAGASVPGYGAVFFEPVAEAALVLGFDVGARFLRGALCDLHGEVRARQDVELTGASAEASLEAIAGLRESLRVAAGAEDALVDGVVVGVPGVVEPGSSRLRLATNVPGLEDMPFGAELSERLGLPVRIENDVNLAALG